MTGFAIVSTTVGTEAEARDLARSLIESRLSACVQMLPIQSVYRWKGSIDASQEHLLLCKISIADFAIVADAIRERHSYDVPEIVMMPIAAGAPLYLDWLAAETSRQEEPKRKAAAPE